MPYDNMKTVEAVLIGKTASTTAASCGCAATTWSSESPCLRQRVCCEPDFKPTKV